MAAGAAILAGGANGTVASAQNPYGYLVTFKTRGQLPPTAIYLSPDDSIQIRIWSPSVTSTIHTMSRVVLPTGEVKWNHADYTVQSVGSTATVEIIPPTECWLMTMAIAAPDQARGQCFVQVNITRETLTSTPKAGGLLMQGYVSDTDRLVYPGGTLESSLAGPGWVHTVAVSNPAAGTDWQLPVPAGVRWRVRAGLAKLSTSAAAGNRFPVLITRDASLAQVLNVPAPTTQIASQAFVYNLAPASPIFSNGGGNPTFLNFPLPVDVILPPGGLVNTSTAGIQAGDQWSNIAIQVEEWVALF